MFATRVTSALAVVLMMIAVESVTAYGADLPRMSESGAGMTLMRAESVNRCGAMDGALRHPATRRATIARLHVSRRFTEKLRRLCDCGAATCQNYAASTGKAERAPRADSITPPPSTRSPS